MNALRAAFSYFSILPVGYAGVPASSALAFLPLVGIVTGLLAGALGLGVSLFAPHALAVATAFGATIALTGAIHLDGFLDASDALFASVAPERRLEIMKDPRHGTYAIAAFAVLASLWLASLWSLPPVYYPGACAFAAGVGRWAMTLNVFRAPYAREGAFRDTIGTPPSIAGWVPWGLLFIATAWFISPVLACAVPFAALGALGLGNWAGKRLGGGLTGDVYGFGITTVEVAVLGTVAVVQASTWVPRI